MVDNVMVGHTSTLELAASAFANNVFIIGIFFGMGITNGLTPLIGKAYGNSEPEKVVQWLKNGIFTHLLAASGLTLVMLGIYFTLPFMGQEAGLLSWPNRIIYCCVHLIFHSCSFSL